ncbi:Integrase recombinase xerD-like, partial [Paramuricea clavata]
GSPRMFADDTNISIAANSVTELELSLNACKSMSILHGHDMSKIFPKRLHQLLELLNGYANFSVWDGLNVTLNDKLQKLQNRAARVITKSQYGASSTKPRTNYVTTKSRIEMSSTAPLFRAVYFCTSKKKYVLCSIGLSYSRAREIALAAFSSLGYPVKNIGLHSLRSGGATTAANAGIRHCLFKRHGRWKSEYHT